MSAVKKSTRKKEPLEPLLSRLFPLTPSDVAILASLARGMTDRLGRSISGAAVIRALVRLAGAGTVTGGMIAEQISQELQTGRLWGKRVTTPCRRHRQA